MIALTREPWIKVLNGYIENGKTDGERVMARMLLDLLFLGDETVPKTPDLIHRYFDKRAATILNSDRPEPTNLPFPT